MGHTYTKKLLTICLKFKLNWVSCVFIYEIDNSISNAFLGHLGLYMGAAKSLMWVWSPSWADMSE